ncbi:MAG: tetratricopeptide repeat protein [Bacteroidota bacterium]
MAKEKKEEMLVDVQQAYTKTEHYIEENKKSLTIILGAIVVLITGYFAWTKLYVAPKEAEAQNQMFVAEKYFEKDSFKLAINGDGNYMGFEKIAEEYGVTKSGNLAHYYLGMSYLKTGQFEKAIEQLNEFDSDDEILAPLAVGAIGDANMELNKTDEAINFYLKAAKERTNNFTTPIFLMKAALAYESQSNFENALKIYEEIKADYSTTTEGREIEKHITKAKLLAGK